MTESSKPRAIRHWYIQKPKAHNCPIGQSGPIDQQGAVFTEFPPTIGLPNCEWIRVYSADDIQKTIGMGLTRYSEVMFARNQALEKIAVLESKASQFESTLKETMRVRDERIKNLEMDYEGALSDMNEMKECIKLLEEVNQSLISALENIEIRLQYCQHTGFPINVRELDGSISQQRSKTNEGHAYDLAKQALESARQKLKGEK